MLESYSAKVSLQLNLLEDCPERICGVLALCFVNLHNTAEWAVYRLEPSLMALLLQEDAVT